MHYVYHFPLLGIVAFNIFAAATFKDFTSEVITPSLAINTTIDTEQLGVQVGYSHDPWGDAHHQRMQQDRKQSRSKRSVLQLYNMVVCATGCNPLIYKGYGCYCGFLGSGYPVDPIDRCCRMHDWCYDDTNCPMFLEYFIPYVWTCYMRRPLCSRVGDICNRKLCECDRKLAECLRRYRCPINKAVCTSSSWRLFQNIIML